MSWLTTWVPAEEVEENPKHNVVQRTELGELATLQKKTGMNWEELNSFKDRMRLRDLPAAMPVSEFAGIEFCHQLFWGLDRCMEYGAAAERPRQPFARLTGCKQHWTLFKRCVNQRERNLNRTIHNWERQFFSQLSKHEQDLYMRDLKTKTEYHEYRAGRALNEPKKDMHNRDGEYVMLRRRNLQKFMDSDLGKEEYDFKREIKEQQNIRNLPGAAVVV